MSFYVFFLTAHNVTACVLCVSEREREEEEERERERKRENAKLTHFFLFQRFKKRINAQLMVITI
jgi:hypothetical protein